MASTWSIRVKDGVAEDSRSIDLCGHAYARGQLEMARGAVLLENRQESSVAAAPR